VEGKGLVHKGRPHRGGRFKLKADISGQGEVFTTGQKVTEIYSASKELNLDITYEDRQTPV